MLGTIRSINFISNPSEVDQVPQNPEEQEDEIDLEDGEIEDDEEEPTEVPADVSEVSEALDTSKQDAPVEKVVENHSKSESERSEKSKDKRKHGDDKKNRRDEKGHRHMTEAEKSILHLRKREKMMRERERWEKNRRKEMGITDPLEDDFAKNIEKTLATILNKKEKESVVSGEEDKDIEKRGKDIEKRGKKRKHQAKEKHKNKQRRVIDSPRSEIDESELLNVRGGGGSPEQLVLRFEKPPLLSPSRSEESFEESEYSTDQSRNEERNRKRDVRKEKRRSRDHRDRHKRERDKRGKEQKTILLHDSQGVCVFYLQGKCQNSDCPYSHEANPPMKLELCKFYLMDCCAKGEKCSYMHSEFPCKFYHTGLQCTAGDECKFAHGVPLSDGLKQILFKHIETAPRDILGGFPRLNRDEALTLINTTQMKLKDQYGVGVQSQPQQLLQLLQPQQQQPAQSDLEPAVEGAAKGGIPSLFDISVPVPRELSHGNDETKSNEKKEKSGRVRPSRWQDPDPVVPSFPIKPFNYGQDQDMRISSNGDVDMRTLAVPNITTPISVQQLSPTVSLTGIQADTTSVTTTSTVLAAAIRDKLSQTITTQLVQNTKDVDIRSTANLIASFNNVPCDVDIRQQAAQFVLSKDVDIRQLPTAPVFEDNSLRSRKESETEDEPMLEIDTGEEEKLNNSSVYDGIDGQKNDADGNTERNKQEERFNLDMGDINWYSDDDDEDRLTIKVEEDENKTTTKDKEDEQKSDYLDVNFSLNSMSPPQIKAIDVVSKLGDLSKIDISAEVTKLLTSMSQNRNPILKMTSEESATSSSYKIETKPNVTPPPYDPRLAKQDPRASGDSPKAPDPRIGVAADPRQRSRQSSLETKILDDKKLSIYEQGGIDINLKNLKALDDDDFKSSLRPDIDLRNLSLPFKNISNYTPATEIDASINSHPPIQWHVAIVEIPRPDYTGLKLSINDAEKTGDPRLKKIFRLENIEKDSPASPRGSPKGGSTAMRVDPRLKKMEEKSENSAQMNYMQQLNVLQGSAFYQSLTSNQKVMLNQELAVRTDQTGTNDPVLHSLLSNLNLVPGTALPGNPNVSSALTILANVSKLNPILGQQATSIVMQPGLLGAAPGIPNVEFGGLNFDPRNVPGLFQPNFPGPMDGPFGNFGNNPMDDGFYPPDNFGNRVGNNNSNRDFGNNNNNRDNRRRGRNFNNNQNRNNRNNFRNNRNNNNRNRNHSPP